MNSKYEKLFTALKYYLLGHNYLLALKALQFARSYHSGTRKDGSTPEFQHQLEICHFILTLKNLENEELTIVCALLHDVMEDYNIPVQTMESEFSPEVCSIVLRLSKVYQGSKKSMPTYFDEISSCPIASIVKGSDRIHNLQSMVGVFSKEKQKDYISEVKTYFLPMIKAASYSHPKQSMAYFNIKHMLKSQIELIEAIHNQNP